MAPEGRVNSPSGCLKSSWRFTARTLDRVDQVVQILDQFVDVLIPLIRISAPYPSRALAKGIEGFIEVSFTVDELGNVIDPSILYAEPEGYFEATVLQTIRRWKYSPAVEEGQTIATHDVRQRIVFEIDLDSR